MSLTKQLESYMFPINFCNKSIVNIVLDYSEDYKPKFDEVLESLTREVRLMNVHLYHTSCSDDEIKHNAYSTNFQLEELLPGEFGNNGSLEIYKNGLLFVQQMLVMIQIYNKYDELKKLKIDDRYKAISKIIYKYKIKN